MTTDYLVRRFRPGALPDGTADPATAAWLQAAALTFLDAEQAEPQLGRVAAAYAANGWTLTAAYRSEASAADRPVQDPVATYGTLDRPLTTVGGGQLTAHLVAGVTVRADHRRRGLLRQVIDDDLRDAAAAGIPVAALFAMQATIYGRFGFGPATHARRVEVDTSEGFGMETEPEGSTDVVSREELARIAPGVFARFHEQTPGSIGRQTFAAQKMAGIWGDDRAEPDPAVRGIVHIDPAGRVDGYAAYRFAGWEARPLTIEVRELVATSPSAHLGLWGHLAAIDNVDRVVLAQAAPDDCLPWALRDRRRYSVVGASDELWLRILDVRAALTARSYADDGVVTIDVEDGMGLAAGVHRLEVRDRVARCDEVDQPAEIGLDVSTLSSLYLGGVSVPELAGAGRVRGEPQAITRLDRMLRPDVAPRCLTHF
jgi:predicted acetyltransferase